MSTAIRSFNVVTMCVTGVFALGHLHGVSTGGQGEPNDLEVARQLMLTCYEMYRRIPTGLSPEIVFFTQHDRGDDYPKQHHMDVGGGDFMVKQQVSSCIILSVPLVKNFALFLLVDLLLGASVPKKKKKKKLHACHVCRRFSDNCSHDSCDGTVNCTVFKDQRIIAH